MNGSTFPVVFCIVAAAAITAALIYGYVPSREAFAFRRMFLWQALKRFFVSCRHAFDPEARRLDRYARAMVTLELAIEIRNGFEQRVQDLAGPQGRAVVQETPEYGIIDRHLERSRARAARYLAAMADEDIAVVARDLQKGILKGEIGQDAVEQFFRDERELIRGMPHMTVGHFDRMERRFNGLLEAAPA